MFVTKLVNPTRKMEALLSCRRWPLYHQTCIHFCLPEKSKCQNDMFCYSQLMSPPSKCYFSIYIVPHCTPHRQTHAGTQTLTHTNCIQKITSLPRRCLKITSVPHHSTNHSPGLRFFPPLLFPSLSPCLTILGFSLHFTSALNCQA